ncbi:unnamed protein product, partial [Oppiella nova]
NDALKRYGTLPDHLKRHRLVCNTYRLALSYQNRLYYQTIQSIAALKPPILALLASTYLPKVFLMAIKVMSFGYSSPNTQFPIRKLSQWLCPFESNAQKADNYIENMCQSYGLDVNTDCIGFNKTKFKETAKPYENQKWSSLEFSLKELSLSSLLIGRHELSHFEE